MLLILVIILLLLWSSVVWSIYSNFMVFYSNFFESENYHKAYYASISALERWELVTKQRQPWYIWSWGFILWEWTWSIHNPDWWSDNDLHWFSYIWDNESETSVFWTVDSRTTRFPKGWKWDIEWTLSYENPSNPSENSDNYNKMDYENAEVFLLYYDRSEDNPYKKAKDTDLAKSNPSQIEWEIRLPKLLENDFWKLDTDMALVWEAGSLPDDDAIVDRQIRWSFWNWSVRIPFTIYSTQEISTYLSSSGQKREVVYDKDSVFRESDINHVLHFEFWSRRSPNVSRGGHINKPTIISLSEDEILKNYLTNKFESIFSYSNFNKSQLRFSLLNLLQWKNDNLVYPFLEYYADFWTIIPDKYYTINGEWNYKDYQINTIVQKPTVKETILWSFTSIFW